MAGIKIGTDPTSSDFLKLIIGNQRLDLMFGLIQPSVLLSRFWTGKTTGTNGKVHELNKEKGPFAPTYGSVGTRFLRTKLAPLPGSTYSLATGTDLVGRKFGWKEWVEANTVPISFGDIYNAMKDQGIPAGSGLGLVSMFGAGLQTQEEKKSTAKPKDIFSSREKKDIFAK